jgi:hypothetical protein
MGKEVMGKGVMGSSANANEEAVVASDIGAPHGDRAGILRWLRLARRPGTVRLRRFHGIGGWTGLA